MSAPLSIIIPSLQPSAELSQVIASLFGGLEAGLIKELIISAGSDAGAFEAIAEDLGALLVTGPAGRGGQLQRGVQRAKGQWLLILHGDTVLAGGWEKIVFDHIKHHSQQAAYFRLHFRDTGLAPWLLAAWANFRSRTFGLPYGDQGLLISRQLYDEIGGYKDIPLMEDVAIVRRLKGRLRALKCSAQTSAEKYQRAGYLRQSLANFSILMRYFMGVSPSELAKSYRQKP